MPPQPVGWAKHSVPTTPPRPAAPHPNPRRAAGKPTNYRRATGDPTGA